jgi:DNA-3-methyladenine glycosylase II
MTTKQKSNSRLHPRFWAKARQHLLAADPTLGLVITKCGSGKLLARDDAFFSLARSIVGQQISVKAAQSIWNKLEKNLGVVTADNVSGRTTSELRKSGVTRQKSGYLIDLAHHFLEGNLQKQDWQKLSDEEVISLVSQIKGVGPWTAQMFLIFHLLRPDVLPLGDIGIQKAMGLHFNGGDRMTPQEMTNRAEPWRPWRSVASWYLWRSLDPLPVDY